MKIEDIYLLLKSRVEKQNTNGGIALDMPRFVDLFNTSTLKFIDDALEKKNDDYIRRIQHISMKDINLGNPIPGEDTINFSLPDNFYFFQNVKIVAEQNGCTAKDFVVFPAKHENVHELLGDVNNEPSFKYRETFYTLGQDQVIFYNSITNPFTISTCLLTYYRYPVKIDISGYEKEDGTMSTNVECEFDDKCINRIVDICVKEFDKNEDNHPNYQYNRDVVYSNK